MQDTPQGEDMTNPHRRPVGNFFIKRSLQSRLIYKIVAAVMISTAVCIGTLLLTYYVKYRNVAFYRVILDHNMDIPPRFEISSIILPALLISALVNFVVAIFIGLYASRKYAVPIYKLEQWADLLRKGKMTAQLQFREREEFKDLSTHCNSLAETLREKFIRIKRQVEDAEKDHKDCQELREIDRIISTLQLEAKPIEVHTQFHRIREEPEQPSQ